MDLDKIKALIGLVGASPLVELELDEGSTKLRLARSTSPGPEPAPVAALRTGTKVAAPASPPIAPVADDAVILSPMMGTFYRRPAPTEASFVEVGSTVQQGDTLALIEAMKVLNKVAAPRAGTVREILIEDGAMVEEDQRLFVIV